MDVHARDVVAQLAAEGIEGQPQHFSWLSQLRMYWEDPPGQPAGQADKTIVVRMMNAQAEYGYEYLGASSRLVVTPLTDRYGTMAPRRWVFLGGGDRQVGLCGWPGSPGHCSNW
jgi:dynein heavy chain